MTEPCTHHYNISMVFTIIIVHNNINNVMNGVTIGAAPNLLVWLDRSEPCVDGIDYNKIIINESDVM